MSARGAATSAEAIGAWARERRDTWEEVHRSYFPDYDQRWQRVAEVVRGACAVSAPRILDLGCGTGPLTCSIVAATDAELVVGVDADPLLVGIARSAAASTRTTFHVSQVGQGASDEIRALGPFDAVVSSAFVHCLDRDALVAMHREARSVLAPGGVLVTAELFAPPGGAPPPDPDQSESTASPWAEWWRSTLADQDRCAAVRAQGTAVMTATVPDPPPLTLEVYRQVLEETGYDAFVWRDGDASSVVVAWPKGASLTRGRGAAAGPRRP